MTSPIPIDTDYTNLDQTSLDARAQKLQEVAFPNWREKSRANFGNIMRGCVAYMTDRLAFYLDQRTRERFITTAQLRQSLLGLVKLIGYAPHGQDAARADLVVTIAGADPSASVTLARGYQVRTPQVTSSVVFQLTEDVTFDPGETSKTIALEHSEYVTEQAQSSGKPNQVFTLRGAPYIDGSLSVAGGGSIVAADGTYSIVSNFLSSGPTDRHVVVRTDSTGRPIVLASNGISGAIPQGSITFTYKRGGGPEGNVEPNTLTIVQRTAVRDSLGNEVRVTCTNPGRAEGGRGQESNLSIRQRAPESIRVLSRAIAREDFELVARTVAGVGRVLCLFKSEDAAIPDNTAMIFVIPEGGGTASAGLLDLVRSRFVTVSGYDPPTHPCGNTLQVATRSALFTTLDFRIKAFRAANVTPAEMKAAIVAALTALLAPMITASELLADYPDEAAALGITAADGDELVPNPAVGFGFEYKDGSGAATGEIPLSDLFNVVRDLPAVRKIGAGAGDFLVNLERDDVFVQTWGFPALGDVTVIDGDTGLVI